MPKKRIRVSSAKAKARKCQNWTAEQISNLVKMPWGKDEATAEAGKRRR